MPEAYFLSNKFLIPDDIFISKLLNEKCFDIVKSTTEYASENN